MDENVVMLAGVMSPIQEIKQAMTQFLRSQGPYSTSQIHSLSEKVITLLQKVEKDHLSGEDGKWKEDIKKELANVRNLNGSLTQQNLALNIQLEEQRATVQTIQQHAEVLQGSNNNLEHSMDSI